MGPYTFRVTDDAAIMEAMSGVSGEHVAGFSTLDACLIGVRTDSYRSHAFQADTLLHELIHCSFRVNGHQFDSDEAEEKIVLAATTNLLHTLRENPAVVAFLTHKE